MATPGDQKCLVPTCRKSGQLSTFKLQAVQKLLECAVERHDCEIRDKLQSILDSHGEEASVELHKSCYCSYTSKDHIKKFVSRKRKAIQADITEAPTARVRRSQVSDFDFKQHCLFCAKVCDPVNSKHPDRWDKVVQCERRGIKDAAPFKDAVLQYCSDRNDEWGREVAMRCHGVYDLAAAEAQYHLRCYNEFRKIIYKTNNVALYDDEAMRLLANEMYANQKECAWSSIELYDKYVGYGGQLVRKQLFTKLVTSLGNDVIVLNIEGCASIVGFRDYISKTFKVTKLDSVDEEKEDELVRKIKTESRGILSSNKSYDISDFTHDKAKQQTSPTLLRFISKLISNGEVTKKSLSLSQSIEHCITNTRNQTALGLGVKLHHRFGSRDLIEILNSHGYIVPYDEVLRFRKSAAKYVEDNATMLHQMMGLTQTVGLIFGWYDNFDLLVSTPNGRRETHAMATEFQMHPINGNAQPGISTLIFPRLTSQQAKSVGKSRAIPLVHYTGPKQVKPPAILHEMHTGIAYADVSARHASLKAAQEADMLWLNSLREGTEAIEWNGFNNQLSRTQGILKPATTYMFGPLIDAPPSHPDTILTTLVYMQKTLTDMGMKYIHLSMDMQLFAVTKQVCWNQPNEFQNVIVHPGGMHIIQSFIGCIGKLMKGSGLEVYIAAAYGGLTSIFNGKSWVKAMRAFRGVSAALLKQFLSTGQKTFEQIEQYLDTACLHPTGRHWVNNFLLPTLLVHQFERAEREGNMHLKQVCLERMMKYFFLAGHVQYARYLTQYLLDMRTLDAEAKVDLVCRHHAGYWNAVSADQFGEQTAIKMGKGALRGMTLSPELVSEWIDAFPITVHVSHNVDNVYSTSTPEHFKQKQHKEEHKHRRLVDAQDRSLIAAEVEKYPHPLDDERPHLYNPVSGQIAPCDVNVADSVSIGVKMECAYIATLPDGFHSPISSSIKTMSILKKQAKGNKVRPVIDLENMFLRLLMIGQQRQIDLHHLFTYELCSVPSSLLDEHSCLRKANKSGLVKRLGILEISPTAPDTIVVDVSQLFYHTVWPHGGYLSDLISSIQGRIDRYPDVAEKIIVFDKYNNISAKDHERMRRAGEVVIDYELSITSPLPKRDIILKSKSNKRRLASVLCTFSLGDTVTMETQDDGAFSHDEADVTIISYVLQAANHGKSVIRVLSDDTDVFVLLVYWVYRASLRCKVQMERWDGTVLDINATCTDLGPKCLQLLGIHALSGCDTVSYPYGKGKISALNTLLAEDFPGLAHVLGEVQTTHTDLMKATEPFFAALYRQPCGTSMEDARFTLFTKKKKAPKIMALPPTSANLLLHVLRAHLQVMLWKAADQEAPPDESANITQFGWVIQNEIPIPAVAQGAPAPPELVDVIKCQCKAQNKQCSTEACSCHKQHLACTSCCNCSGGEACRNPHSVRPDTNNEEENDADDDYFECDIVVEDVEEEECGDIYDDYINADEEFELAS